jgi:hypothetical protein
MNDQAKTKKDHKFLNTRPVARFYYKGNHSHPVRRTVILIDVSDQLVTGYELREGMTVRDFRDAPIKSFRKDRIATMGQLDKRWIIVNKTNINKTTLRRYPLNDYLRSGA